MSKTIVCQSEESCLIFRSLADKLYSLEKIVAQVADNAKNQFDKFIQAASFEHKDSFLRFNRGQSLYIPWLIFSKQKPVQRPMAYLQDHIYTVPWPKYFSVSKEVLQDNLRETSLISQRLVYDTLQSNNAKPQEFIITKDLCKNSMLLYQKYELELQKAAENKTKSTRELKRRQKFDEIENIKKQNWTFQKTNDSLGEGSEKETLEAEKKSRSWQYFKSCFISMYHEREKTKTELTDVEWIV